MKKKLYLITTILLSAAALSLSSCLKDNRYVDFSKGSNVVDFATACHILLLMPLRKPRTLMPMAPLYVNLR